MFIEARSINERKFGLGLTIIGRVRSILLSQRTMPKICIGIFPFLATPKASDSQSISTTGDPRLVGFLGHGKIVLCEICTS